MKSKIYGGLCIVTLVVSSACHCLGFQTNDEGKNPDVCPNTCEVTEQDQSLALIVEATTLRSQKAVSAVAVGSKSCGPCVRLRTKTVEPMQEDGYDIKYVTTSKWPGKQPKSIPMIYYYNEKGRLIFKELGYKTIEHVKKRLKK